MQKNYYIIKKSTNRNVVRTTTGEDVAVAKTLRFACNLLFSILFGLVLVQLFLYNVQTDFVSALLLFPFLFLALWAFPHIMRSGRIRGFFHCFSYGKAWILIQIPGILVLAAAFFTNKLEPSWDWGHTINIAIQYVTEGSTSLLSYVAAYANNRFWITVLICFFKIILRICPSASAEVFKTALWILSDLLVIATVNLIYFTARCYLTEKKAFFTGTLAALYLPVSLYGQISYTDVPGMFLCALTLFLYCRLRRTEGRKKLLLLIFLGIVAAIGYKLKVLVFIPVLAILIEESLRGLSPDFFQAFRLKSPKLRLKGLKPCLLHMAIAACSFGLMFEAAGVLSDHMLAIPDGMIEEYELPLTHWIMMGLKGNGGYNGEDYGYTTGISGYQEKVSATVSVIKERLGQLDAKGLLKHIFHTKVRRTWCHSMLGSDDYTERNPLQESSLFRELFSKSGSLSRPAHILVSDYYFMLMRRVLASGIFSLIKSGKKASVLP
ncbi:MAG: glycosyltransferase family 39 protein, partial [Lachnospiraceae bacterium]|nr:glycosyltransferase family 39 protein [Lachnospiraceae bacterium]